LMNVIEVVVSEEVARDRVLGRARGADDNNTVFDNRMKVYTEPLSLIQNFYDNKKMLVKLDGERSIEAIVDELETFIKTKI
jgi:adenylate kinase